MTKDTRSRLLARVEEGRDYCRQRGIAEATFGRRALANMHSLDRLERKIETLHADLERMEKYMEEHPPYAATIAKDK